MADGTSPQNDDVNPFAGRDSFEDEVFDGLKLERADFSGREFYRCTFKNSKLSETKWRRARLDECTFEACDLTRIDPTMLALRDVSFKGCKLMGIDFTDVARFPHVSFEDCSLRYASFVSLSLRKTPFKKCLVNEANFFEVDLRDSKLEDCVFTGTRFEACDLRSARFPNAQGLFIDPARNRVKDTRVPLESAILLTTALGLRVLGFNGQPDDEADEK